MKHGVHYVDFVRFVPIQQKKIPQMSSKKKIMFNRADRLIHVQLLAVFVDFSRHRQILLHTGILGMVPSFQNSTG